MSFICKRRAVFSLKLIKRRFAYVSISRASHDTQIYTNDAGSLASSLSQDITKSSAIDDRTLTKAYRGQDITSELSLEKVVYRH